MLLSPRAVALAASAALGVVLSLWERGTEFGYVLEYLALVTVSVLASQWLTLLVLNIVVAGAWLAFVGLEIERVPWLRARLVNFNRHVGHVEALGAWTLFALIWIDTLWIRVTAAALVALYGVQLLDEVTRRLMRYRNISASRFHLVRRRLFYLATVLGFVFLVVINRSQFQVLSGLALAVGVGILLRWLATSLTNRAYAREESVQRVPWLLHPTRRFMVPADRAVVIVVAVLVSSWIWKVENERSRHAGIERLERLATIDDCHLRAELPKAAMSLFIVSDSQFHELRGSRSGVQLDLIDQVVPVATRPVELDLLSGATLGHFADLYRDLRKDRPDMLWAHLGDIGDVGCHSELTRFGAYLSRFGGGTLAGIAPGNHDSTFFGNFAWHPDWEKACRPSWPLDKASSNQTILDLMTQPLSAAEPSVRALSRAATPANPPLSHPRWQALLARKTALPTVTRLGRLSDGRSVCGAFLDSSDYNGFGIGIAGVQGAISSRQVDWLAEQLESCKDDYLILFSHHPYDELSFVSRRRIERLTAPFGDRLLVFVSAHTHLAARRTWKLNQRDTAEIVVGSVIDAPQEAAILEVFERAEGGPLAVVRTIPSVVQENMTCGLSKDIEARACAGLLRNLRQQPACQPLFRTPDFRHPGPASPEDVKRDQSKRATALLECVCRTEQPAGPSPRCPRGQTADALDTAIFDELSMGSPERKLELTCLSWAGSILQSNKHQGWALNRALAYGFDSAAAMGPLLVDSSPPH